MKTNEETWQLSLVYDTRGYVATAIFPAPRSLLKTAHEARAFVWERARMGDADCRRALSEVAASELAGKSTTRRRKTKRS